MNNLKELHKRFLNEDVLLHTSKSKTFRRIKFYWTLFFAATFIPATILCGAGFKEEYFNFPHNTIYFISLGFIVLYFIFAAVFLVLSIKSKLFKSKGFLFLVAGIPLLGILLASLMSFTGIPYIDNEGAKQTNDVIPVAYMLFVALPAAVVYLVFCYYSFLFKLIQTSLPLLKKETKEALEASKEASEDFKKEMFNTVTYKYHAHKYEKNKEKEL